jgi:hypothetical protein
MTETYEIAAVHDRDFEKFLGDIGVLSDVKEGRASCKFCKTKITLDNLQAVYPTGNEIVFCCNNTDCFRQSLAERKSER